MIGDVPGSPAAQRCLLKCLQASAPGVTSNPKTETQIRNLEQTETQTPNLTRYAQSDMRECARDVDNAVPCTPNSNISCIAERKQKKNVTTTHALAHIPTAVTDTTRYKLVEALQKVVKGRRKMCGRTQSGRRLKLRECEQKSKLHK
jgi:hypothetical protein